jgi:hypothetical protein
VPDVNNITHGEDYLSLSRWAPSRSSPPTQSLVAALGRRFGSRGGSKMLTRLAWLVARHSLGRLGHSRLRLSGSAALRLHSIQSFCNAPPKTRDRDLLHSQERRGRSGSPPGFGGRDDPKAPREIALAHPSKTKTVLDESRKARIGHGHGLVPALTQA